MSIELDTDDLNDEIGGINFGTVSDIAKAYGLNADDLHDEINAINHAYLFHRCPLPKPSEDPIPELVQMAQNLLVGCRAQREFDRLEATAQVFDDKDFVDAGDYVGDLLASLETLGHLLAHAPRHGGKRPLDVNEFFAVRKLGKFWEANRPDRPITEKFDGARALSLGGAFVCDVIECVIAECRTFTNNIATELDDFDARTREIRSSVTTQIRNYVAERRAAKKR